MELKNIIQKKGTKSIESMKPHERRLIMVTENQVESRPRWENFLLLLHPIAPISFALAKIIYDLFQTGCAQLVHIGDASDTLEFPPNHPNKETLYILHPLHTNRYYPASDFARLLYEEKAREFTRILRELKIRRADFSYMKGARSFAGIGVKFNKDLDLKTSADLADGMGISGSLICNPPPGEINPDLSSCVWLKHEPLWQELVELRTKNGLQNTTFTFTHSGLASVSADIRAVVEKVTVELQPSGNYESETIWSIHLDFASTDSSHLEDSSLINKVKNWLGGRINRHRS